VKNRPHLGAVSVEEREQCLGFDGRLKAALGDGPSAVAGARAITYRKRPGAALFQPGDQIRANKTGSARH
jgi:hypothetical protein